MAVVSVPNTFSPNTTISSSQVNSNFTTIYNEFNGNIAAANLATGAVTTAKIADSNVTTAKIADSNVTTAKIADGAVTPAKRSGGFYATLWNASGIGTGAGKTITGIGFTPKALMVLGINRTSATQAATTHGYCYYNGSSYIQGNNTLYSASGTSDTGNSDTTYAFYSMTGSTQFTGTVTGFSNDTITLTVGTNNGDGAFCKFHIMVFG